MLLGWDRQVGALQSERKLIFGKGLVIVSGIENGNGAGGVVLAIARSMMFSLRLDSRQTDCREVS